MGIRGSALQTLQSKGQGECMGDFPIGGTATFTPETIVIKNVHFLPKTGRVLGMLASDLFMSKHTHSFYWPGMHIGDIRSRYCHV